MAPDLDHWLAKPTWRITYGRDSRADPDTLWTAARSVVLADAGLLGRLIRWRIPGTDLAITFDELFRTAPFVVLEQHPRALVSGLVGRIWTLRRDYPQLSEPGEFIAWSTAGTARVLFAHWVDSDPVRLASEARVDAFGVQGRLGLAAVRPLVKAFKNLILSEGLEAAVRRAERIR